MKLEIIKCSTCEKIETYSVQDFSMLDFQEWKEQNEGEVTINLACLSDTATNLNSVDPETLEPVSDSREVDFYLPNPLIEKVFDQLKKSQVDTEEVSEQVSTSKLKSSKILSAIVTEILQNHHPHSEYEVRISDG